MADPHFDALAPDYDRLRTGGGQWESLANRTLEALGPARRLLDAGCGTGRFSVFAAEQLGARVWGIDPSAQMLAEARKRATDGPVGWRQASVEALPFKNAWFDAAHMHLVIHLIRGPGRALDELARVLLHGGQLAIATFHLDHFERFYLNEYFPSIPVVDLARFPDPALLADELGSAGFAQVQTDRISVPAQSAADDVLERVRGRYISTLSAIPEDEYAAGLARLEIDLLDDQGLLAVETQLPATAGTAVQGVNQEQVDLVVGNRARSCMGWPGWPPGLRLSCPGARGGGGLTMSEEGGLEEVEESLRAAASCSSRRVTAACNCSSCACNRWHPAQGFVAASAMLTFYSRPA